jgi:His/Glu/Gln/Arg/opine family amino acid ABC transporter permease subunit
VEPKHWAKVFSGYTIRFLLVAFLLALILAVIYWRLSENYAFNWNAALRFTPAFNTALLVTLKISLLGMVFGMLLGLIVALGRLSPWIMVRDLATLYVHTFRNVPFLVYVFFVYFGLGRAVDIRPLFEPLGWVVDERIVWGVVALSTFEAGFIAEIFRAGIQSIHKEQMESARALGLTYLQSMRYVILPQAFRNIIPALTGELIALVKESALLMVISVEELTLTARQLVRERFMHFEFFALLAVYYLMITLPLAGLSHVLERKLAIGRQER